MLFLGSSWTNEVGFHMFGIHYRELSPKHLTRSTMRLPVNKKPFSSLLCLPSLSIITLGSSAFRLNRIHSFSRLSLSFRFRKQPLLSRGLTAAILERLRDVSRCFQLRMRSRDCAVQNRGMTLMEHCPW